MDQKLENYVRFFRDQISEKIAEYRHLLDAPIKQLIASDNAFYATVHGLSEDWGNIILKVDRRHAPRLKEQKSFVLIKRAARERWGERPADWGCSFKEFLEREEFHSSSSQLLPIYFLKNDDPSYLYLGCGGVSSRMFQKIKGMLADGIVVRLLIYDTEPPVRYLANLADYIEQNENDQVLLTVPRIAYDEWRPELLSYDPSDAQAIPRKVIEGLSASGCVVLQGPPGTGKSYAAACIIAEYLAKGKSVCVAAMANKALMELILQSPLRPYLSGGKLSKTMMTSDEGVEAKGLRDVGVDDVVPKGEAMFATYYKLSNQFRRVSELSGRPLYDLVVVEEASQAYLTTLAAAIKLGKECLIVGDPMQLAPIVTSENKAEYKRWNVALQSDGLSSFALGTDVRSFRITTTFRLTPSSAALTGIFYGNTLRSVSPANPDWSVYDAHYFPREGGVVHDILSGGEDGVLSQAAASAISDVLSKLSHAKRGASVAIITPFKDSAKAIQKRFAVQGESLDLSVETIDRVQGATVDYAVIYFPLRNASFALNERRFNVATSRSRTTTLILSDFDLLTMRSVTGRVREFLQRVGGTYRERLPDKQAPDVAPTVTALNQQQASPTLSEIQTLLDNVEVFLSHWLQTNLNAIYGSRVWQDGVVAKLTDLQRENVRDDGAQAFYDLDFASLITVFTANFRELKRRVHFKQELVNIARQMKDIRVTYAHKNAKTIVMPDVKTIQYHIDTTEQFLLGLGTNSTNVAVAVEKLQSNLSASAKKA